MRSSYGSFQEVAKLPDGAIHRLLDEGEPVERVWAAWTLGLRGGRAAAGQVAEATVADPDAGARRHFVVILVGLGETKAVVALAKDDPDGRVRATACQYVAQLALRDPTLWPVPERGLADDDADVRETVVRHLPDEAPVSVRDEAIELLADESRAVRQAVVERLEAWLRSRGSLPDIVERQAFLERDFILRSDLLALWLERAGAGPVLRAACDAPPEAVSDLCDLLHARKAPCLWQDVAPLVGRSSDVDEKVFRIFEMRLEEAALTWVLRHLAGPRRGWDVEWPISGQLARRLERAHPDDLDADARAALRAIADQLSEGLEGLDDWTDEETEQLRSIVRSADRLAPRYH